MAHQVKVLVPPVELPEVGLITTVNTIVTLSDQGFATISPTAFISDPPNAPNPILQDLGVVGGSGPVTVQAAFVAAPAALTSAQDGALTSSQNSTTNATATSSQNSTTNAATQTGSYVQADVQTIATLANALKTSYNAAQSDLATAVTLVNALKTSYNALQTDVVALRTAYNAAQADIAALRTTLAAELTALQVAGGPQSNH